MRPVIGITLGDPAGVGPEIVRAALDSGQLDRRFEYRIIGDLPEAVPGQPTAEGARAALAALEEAALLALRGELAAVVTGPIHKARMAEIGFRFPGQTEFFAARCGVADVTMCLAGGGLTVGLVTAHVPLREVPALITEEAVIRAGRHLAHFVHARNQRPARVAVAGLNPHAGEQGLFGSEDRDAIAPAVARLNAMEIRRPEFLLTSPSEAVFTGPLPPDTVFFRAAAAEFDAVLAMYHDQGLGPLKLHAFDKGVNITLGLPFPRTSPDHGTAFDIAGSGRAKAGSMIEAVRLAGILAAR